MLQVRFSALYTSIFPQMSVCIVLSEEELNRLIDERALAIITANQQFQPRYTAEEVCKKAKISKVTLWSYIRTGRLTPLPRLHERCKLYFESTEVERFFSAKQKYRRATV